MSHARRETLTAATVAALVLLPAAADAEVRARISLGSTYVHRGLEQSIASPVYQGALEYQAADWFAGVWASTVDFGGYDDRSSEIDYYLGYGRRLSRNLSLEGTLIRYTYQGRSSRNEDWTELQLSAYVADRWTFTWGIAENWWATDGRTRFIEATFRHPLPVRLTLDATLGYHLTERAAGIDYAYGEAGVSRSLGDFAFRVGYAAVESKARERFFRFARNQWVASLTWQP